jgi:tungstate transport system ATP-binding protein
MSLLYTASAMIIAQLILAFPIVAALSHSAIVKIEPLIKQASLTLGATPFQVTTTVMKEARYGIMAGIIASFGRVMAEVGAILIVGGNIAGYTRVMTTTIALETDKGNFELALALGIILLIISFIMNLTLVVSRICKSFNAKPVLKDCSFSFEKSGTYVLMGPNGSGKSTFFRICALLEEPDAGEVRYFSGTEIVKKDVQLRRRITLLLPRVGVFNTTVSKNVSYGLRIRGTKGIEINEKVDKALEFVGLTHKRSQNALTLSSGETQRLGIARALVLEPEIIFLDEPTASVDQENTSAIEDIILRMKKKGSSMVIIATHDMPQAERLADRLLIMKDGRIVST